MVFATFNITSPRFSRRCLLSVGEAARQHIQHSTPRLITKTSIKRVLVEIGFSILQPCVHPSPSSVFPSSHSSSESIVPSPHSGHTSVGEGIVVGVDVGAGLGELVVGVVRVKRVGVGDGVVGGAGSGMENVVSVAEEINDCVVVI